MVSSGPSRRRNDRWHGRPTGSRTRSAARARGAPGAEGGARRRWPRRARPPPGSVSESVLAEHVEDGRASELHLAVEPQEPLRLVRGPTSRLGVAHGRMPHERSGSPTTHRRPRRPGDRRPEASPASAPFGRSVRVGDETGPRRFWWGSSKWAGMPPSTSLHLDRLLGASQRRSGAGGPRAPPPRRARRRVGPVVQFAEARTTCCTDLR